MGEEKQTRWILIKSKLIKHKCAGLILDQSLFFFNTDHQHPLEGMEWNMSSIPSFKNIFQAKEWWL